MNETAILMAAGLGSRMRPITERIPKPLVKVFGIPMIETLIEALKSRGVKRFYIVTGYLGEQFSYLTGKYEDLKIITNPDYRSVNNISSIKAVSDVLISSDSDIFICEADLYIRDKSIFDAVLDHSCYFGKMVKGHSDDWVFSLNEDGRVIRVGKVGDDCYNMVGIAWFKTTDAHKLGRMINSRYGTEGYEDLFWDDVVNENLEDLRLYVHEVRADQLVEIDTVEELSAIDPSYRLSE